MSKFDYSKIAEMDDETLKEYLRFMDVKRIKGLLFKLALVSIFGFLVNFVVFHSVDNLMLLFLILSNAGYWILEAIHYKSKFNKEESE